MPNPKLQNSYKLPSNISDLSAQTQPFSSQLQFGELGYFDIPSNFQYVTPINNKVRRAAIGTAHSEWKDKWDQARLKTGRFDSQLGLDPTLNKPNWQIQKENRDTAKFLYTPDEKTRSINGVSAYGSYDPMSHTGWLGNRAVNNTTVFVHESAHSSRAVPQLNKIESILDRSLYNDPYLDDSDEIHSRLNELRYFYNLDPSHEYTPKEIDKLKKKKNGFNILNRYDDNTLLKLINDVASVSQSTNPLLAKFGTKLPILFKKNGKKY